jgi:high-affinity nickel-transport protein
LQLTPPGEKLIPPAPLDGGVAMSQHTESPSRRTRNRSAARFGTRDWQHLAGMLAIVLGLTALGWGLLLVAVLDEQHITGSTSFGLGIGLTAYGLGVRHAFDADHISAIDNTTRKLIADGQRPLSVGFWFSLGHSTVVFALTLLLVGGIKALAGPVADENSGLHEVTGVIGGTVSGVFLYLIAAVNLVVLAGLVRGRRRGEHPGHGGFGPLTKLFGRVMRSITRSGHMYPVGLLFGLGFDTATEVGLLVLAATSAAGGLPWYAVLCLPVLFAAGMSLFDTLDGSFMNVAYTWASADPDRRLSYNIAVTALSAGVALVIGTVQLLSTLAEQAGLAGGFWDWLGGLDLNALGFAIVGLFLVVWLAALATTRLGRRREVGEHVPETNQP